MRKKPWSPWQILFARIKLDSLFMNKLKYEAYKQKVIIYKLINKIK